MRIALVNPPVARRYVDGVDEPLHLEYLAAQIKDRHELVLIDALGLRLSPAETLEQVLEASPQVVGLSLGFSAAYQISRSLCEDIKRHDPRTWTILGGNTASFMADTLAGDPFVDAIVRDEGDLALPEVLDAIEAAAFPSEKINGISYCAKGAVVHTSPRPLIRDLDSLPFPARDCLPLADVYTKVVLAARGCPYGCVYCSASAFWRRRFRTRSVPNILREVERIAPDLDAGYFAFGDDCFTLVPERAQAVCDGLVDLDLGCTWGCTGRIETITRPLLAAMSGAGCRAIFFGVESGSPAVLKKLGRRYTPAQVQEVYRRCLEEGIRPTFSFIVGLPFEREQDLEQTFDLILRLEGVECGVHMLTPFPGTPIAQRPADYGLRVAPHVIDELEMNTSPVAETEFLSREQIQGAFRKGVGYAYRALRRRRHLPSPP